jgi:hypothetical protein
MTARILGIELRRSTAMGAAALIVVSGTFLLYGHAPLYPWWIDLVVVQRDILQVLWPLALGAGAWQARRERRSRIEELIAATPRPRWRRVAPTAAAMAIGTVAAYLVMLAAASGRVRDVGGYFPTGALSIVAVGALSLVAAAWLGLAIGSLLPWALTPPMLAVAGFAGLALPLGLFVGQNRRPPGAMLLLPYLQVSWSEPGLMEFMTLSRLANLSQVVWLASLAATGLALFAGASGRIRLAALLPVVVGAAITLSVLPRHVSAAFVPDRGAMAMTCTSDALEVCVTRVHAAALADLGGPGREALAILAAKLPQAPTTVEEHPQTGLPSRPLSAHTLRVKLIVNANGRVDASREELLWSLLDGAGTTPCPELVGPRGSVDVRYLKARQVAAAWLIGQTPSASSRAKQADPAQIRVALRTLRSLPAEEQRARVAALREAELTCAGGDRLDILTGPGGPR